MNVFFVLSPLQLINVLEAKAFFGTEDNTLIVLRDTSQGYPISMFKRLIGASEWDRIIYLTTFDDETITTFNRPYEYYRVYKMRRLLDKLAASLGPVQNLFIGHYTEPAARHFINVLSYTTCYLVDDGSNTLGVNTERKRLGTRYALPLRTALRNAVLGLRPDQPEALTFFTVYDLEPLPGDTVVPNTYTHFRQLIKEVPQSDEVWFLGEPLSRDRYVTRAVYLDYLALAKDFYRDYRFVYLPHSREERTDVDDLQRILGCEVRRYGLPVEVALSRAAARPREIVSFITAAISTCAAMFGETLPLTSLYLEPRHLLKHHTFVESVYAYFRTSMGPNVRVMTHQELSNGAAATLERSKQGGLEPTEQKPERTPTTVQRD